MTKDFLIATLNQGKAGLISTFDAIPDDKLNWKPLDNGRAALDLVGDAAQTASLARQVLAITPGSVFPPFREIFAKLAEERANWSKDDALAHLESNHQALIAAIGELSEEELARPLSLPTGSSEMTLPLAGWALMAYRTYISRFAQINYIQTLYGDFDAH